MNAKGDSNLQDWQKLEVFVKEKAREYRTEQLKRDRDPASPAEAFTPASASRTILKVKRRKK